MSISSDSSGKSFRSDTRLRIETASEVHAEDLERLVRATFHLACPPDSDRNLQSIYIDKNLSAAHFKAIVSSENNRTWVAIDEQCVVGFVLLELVSEKVAILSKLYVSESHQKGGIAKQLYDEAYVFFEQSPLHVLRLSVFSGNEKAKRFYRKRGFEFIRKIEFQMEGESHQDEIFQLDKHLDYPYDKANSAIGISDIVRDLFN